MSDNLRSARTKLARANLHTGIAKREAARFFDRHPQPTFKIEPEGDMGTVGLGTVVSARLIVGSAPPDLPPSFAARFGDAIHNYRSVLDHIAWQLVRHGGSWPLKDKWAESAVQFPIYNTSTGFIDMKDRRLPGVCADVVDFIQARHKYVGGNATNYALLGLANLTNDDKHRSLHLFASIFKTLQSEVTFTRCLPLVFRNPEVRPALKEGAVLAHFSYRVTGSNPEVTMNLTPVVQIVIEDGRDFSEMLEGIKREVTEILDAPEILAAVV
jgi:hypothetical protein